ncbi:fused MFS/spermidine synthase [Arthrobacter zhangbolii]|uniref:Fused MFS/spermidine synthase n=1 Tax=Arthrobacter zhangbolii TaxID=2886936 RepID=A0A9X1S8A7_9MICC|nr:fused MFS/spermidine synthase [Arthrobacter zhangbolii]MCC3271152.1 fused MFS/spermidine synthase [Arthrobacter zhangbolii]UON91053.1 fused MFS/spermidine synthase [Arthrobacter zhangbolii]
MTASRLLRGIGAHAAITEDGFTPGAFVLSIGGAEQSHVDLARPEEIFYEYLRRMGNVLDLAAAPGQPLRALHLGAGALTLTRYLQATRPGSEQVAVELERELLDFVLAHLPLPEGTHLETVIGDARESLDRFAGRQFDAVVLDIFAGADAPGHLTTAEFYAELARLLSPDGVLLVNVGDDPPLAFARRQIRELLAGLAAAGCSNGDVAALGPADMFTGRYPGNIVLAATPFGWPEEWTRSLLAAGPHPAAVLTGEELDVFASGA